MIERGAGLPMSDRVERGPGRVLRSAVRVAAQSSWGTSGVWRGQGLTGLVRSGPEVNQGDSGAGPCGPVRAGPGRAGPGRVLGAQA